MGKNKLRRFAENDTFPNLIQPELEEVFRKDHPLKGFWNANFFKDQNPIVLELGCGKGEYTVGLAELFPYKNFIGIDIKGARMWRGAKTAHQKNMPNVGFVRTRIEHISSFFARDEVSEIWITFPDPQPKWIKENKRLTSAFFLNQYKLFLKPNGLVHLKTDSLELHNYTLNLIKRNHLTIHQQTQDLYGSDIVSPVLSIRTFYESQFLEKGKKITYLCFSLDNAKIIT